MKTLILAGGSQSTIHPEREGIPKPMIEIGERPLLWHIMKSFSRHGISEFIVCGGYKVEMIKEYFTDFYIYGSDITVNLATNTVVVHKSQTEDWKVTVVDTGLNTSAFDRVKKVKDYLPGDFFVTYGDCLSDIDFKEMTEQHQSAGKSASIAMVRPTGRKQFLSFNKKGEMTFNRLGKGEMSTYGWISGTIYLLKPEVLDMPESGTLSEESFFAALSRKKEVTPYYHNGFWTSIETLRDLVAAEKMWEAGIAPWYPFPGTGT